MIARHPQGSASRLHDWLFDLLRILVTLAMVAIAAASVWWVREQQQAHPWTRDGQVLCNLVQVAPQVAGPVIAVHVTDNQRVAKGDVLFEIDPTPFEEAVHQAEAELAAASADGRGGAANHHDAPSDASATTEQTENTAARGAGVALAKLAAAHRRLALARVTAPVSGFVTNLTLAAGSQVEAGTPQIALVEPGTFWVDAYFKETDLAAIHPGDPAAVVLMSAPDRPLTGRVLSIAHGIARRNMGKGPGDLAQVAPTFEWIRLAQRIPVHIELIDPPADLPLRIGTTASVTVRPSATADDGAAAGHGGGEHGGG